MFLFLMPRPSETTLSFTVNAKDVQAAYHRFVAEHWREKMAGTFGIWNGDELLGRVTRHFIHCEEEYMSRLELFPEPEEHQNSLACGD